MFFITNYQTTFFNYLFVWLLPLGVLEFCDNVVLLNLGYILVQGLLILAIKYIFNLIRFVSVFAFIPLLSPSKLP